MSVIVVGGGFAGCAAALSAAKAGVKVTLIERMDMLLGCGLDGGLMNLNGRYTAAEELKVMGAGDIFVALESLTLRRPLLPSQGPYSYIYNISLGERTIRNLVQSSGVEIQLESRAIEVEKSGSKIVSVDVKKYDGVSGRQTARVEGDAFVDCTGTAGGVEICTRYGKGCVMCTMRCPAFGDRVSIATKAGAHELMRYREDGTPGSLSSAVTVNKQTLSPNLRQQLEEKGIMMVPLPEGLVDARRGTFLTNTNLTEDHVKNMILCDVGYGAKAIGAVYFPLQKLRTVPGFENARLINPTVGDWNAVRFVSMAPRDDALKVDGFKNLFCAGEKSGPMVGICEAIVTGTLAGHNAARTVFGVEPLELSRVTAIGDLIAYTNELIRKQKVKLGYSFQGGPYFEIMKKTGLYSEDKGLIEKRVREAGLKDIFSKKPQ